jgi:hypothetical protein
MVHDYEKKVASETNATYDDCIVNTPREAMEPLRENEQAVARGRLCPLSGREIPLTDKARVLTKWNPSPAFLKGYDLIAWD